MFVIKMLDGEEVRESRGDILTLNHCHLPA